MANTFNGGSIYIDATGASGATTVKVTYVLFTPDATGDELKLTDGNGGAVKFQCKGATAKQTLEFDFSRRPIVFNSSVYVATLTASATAMVYTTTAGSEG
jgi:hypothetical protein